MSLLEARAIYKPLAYPWAFSAFQTQNSILWLPEEVPMGDDVADWKKKLTDNERALLTQVFRFFVQADVGVNESYLTNYMQVFKPTEVRMMLSAFANMESIHVHGYAFLIDTLGMPETEFSAFLDYKEMRDKWEYMQQFGVGSARDVALTLAAFGAGIEGLSLFASFAILLSFPRRGLMKGMGQIVAWSSRDETLHTLSMIRLFHTFLSENPKIWNKEFQWKVATNFHQIATHENAFVRLAFAQGGIEGITEQEVQDYITYLAIRRLTQLGVPQPMIAWWFPRESEHNPLPWLDEMMSAIEHANFFEARATEYQKAATEGSWEDAFNEKTFGGIHGSGADTDTEASLSP